MRGTRGITFAQRYAAEECVCLGKIHCIPQHHSPPSKGCGDWTKLIRLCRMDCIECARASTFFARKNYCFDATFVLVRRRGGERHWSLRPEDGPTERDLSTQHPHASLKRRGTPEGRYSCDPSATAVPHAVENTNACVRIFLCPSAQCSLPLLVLL